MKKITSKGPLVDVVVAAWNRAETIERAVISACKQPEVASVIVVDDASTDQTATIVENLSRSHKVVVVRLQRNSGPSVARNVALQKSTAPWIAILDGDDLFLPGRIGALLSIVGDSDLIADDILSVDEGELETSKPQPVIFSREFEPWQLDFETFVLGNIPRRGITNKHMGFLKPLIRRSFLVENNIRYDEDLRLGEDFALYACALAKGARFLVVPAKGYVAVTRANSLSMRHTRRDLEKFRDFNTRLIKSCARLKEGDSIALAKHYRSIDARVQWLNVIDAVKARNITGFFNPFFRSPTVFKFLIRRLVGEIPRRLWRTDL
jgi:succinoglycan biosynthesis protein ExoU